MVAPRFYEQMKKNNRHFSCVSLSEIFWKFVYFMICLLHNIIFWQNLIQGFLFFKSKIGKLRILMNLPDKSSFLTWKIFINFQVVVVGRFHSFTPLLRLDIRKPRGELPYSCCESLQEFCFLPRMLLSAENWCPARLLQDFGHCEFASWQESWQDSW